MVPFLFYFSSYFAQIGITVFKATFCISTFWHQKGAKFLWGSTPLNPLSGYKKSAIGSLMLRCFRGSIGGLPLPPIYVNYLTSKLLDYN